MTPSPPSKGLPARPPAPVAVIGLDRVGLALADAVALHPDLALAVVADPRPEHGRARAAAHGIPFAPAYLDVLDDPTLAALIVAGEQPDRATVIAEAGVR